MSARIGFVNGESMEEAVLVLDRAALSRYIAAPGFWPTTAVVPTLLQDQTLQFIRRADAEITPAYVQLIPYVLLHHRGSFFTYCRNRGGSETRLHGKWSIGFGGHINADDGPNGAVAYWHGLHRELVEELATIPASWLASPPTVLGLVYDDRQFVAQLHLGIVHQLDWPDAVVPLADATLEPLGFKSRQELLAAGDLLESWSSLIIAATN